MTAMIYILYFTIATLKISLLKGHALIPPHPNLLHHVRPALPSLRQISPASVKSTDPKIIIDEKKSTDSQNKLIDIDSSNTNRLDDIHSPKTRSPDDKETIEELDYLATAANPVDIFESNSRASTKNSSESFEYKMQKMNASSWSSHYQSSTKSYDNQETPIPYKIWTQNSATNNNEDQSESSSLINKMSDYFRVMNITRNFQNPFYEDRKNQTRESRNVLDDFQKSLSQSSLFQNVKSSLQGNSNNKNTNNFGSNSNDQSKNLQSTNPADKIWNSATNFAGNVAERAFNLADNFVAAVLNPENNKNDQFFKPNNENGYQQEYRLDYRPEYRPEYRTEYHPVYNPEYRVEYRPEYHPEYSPEYRPEYRPEYKSQSFQQIGFSNPTTGMVDRNIQINRGYYINREFNPYRPFYNGGYYEQNDSSGGVSATNSTHINRGYYYNRSNPTELLSNPTTQYSVSRGYRQMSPTNYEGLQLLRKPTLTNYKGINSGSAIVNSALNLAQSIVGGDYDKIARSSVNMGIDIGKAASENQIDTVNAQTFKRSSLNEDISNLATTLADDVKFNTNKNETVLNITPNLVDSIDTLSTEKVDYIEKNILPSNTNQNPSVDISSKTDKIAIHSGPYKPGQIFNLATPLPNGTLNARINPTLVGIKRILRSPYGNRSYLGIIPLRTLYNPTTKFSDASNPAVNLAQSGTAYLYL